MIAREQYLFFSQFRRRFATTGAITPSSRFLARALTRFLAARSRQSPVRVLEIGPGTGAVTGHIASRLQPGDTFDLVEVNPLFAEFLQSRFQSDAAWRKAANWSTIHQVPIQQFESAVQYDYVISGLPLNNFAVDTVREISAKYVSLLKPSGVLSYFEYMYVREVRKWATKGVDKARILAIDKILHDACSRYGVDRDRVWINIPPAWVHHWKLPTSSA